MSQIEICTDDLKLLDDLRAANVSGIKLYEIVMRNDDAELAQHAITVCNFIIDIAIDLDTGLLGTWLYERIKNRTNQITVNGEDISAQPEKITVIVQNIVIHAANENISKQ